MVMMVVLVIMMRRRRAHMVFFLMVMELLFVICEALLEKKTTILLPTINLPFSPWCVPRTETSPTLHTVAFVAHPSHSSGHKNHEASYVARDLNHFPLL